MTVAIVQNGVVWDGTGGGTPGILVPPVPTAYYPGDTISTLSDVDIARLIAAGVLVNPAFQVVFFEGGPAQILVPT
jgi:hypothetical protein